MPRESVKCMWPLPLCEGIEIAHFGWRRLAIIQVQPLASHATLPVTPAFVLPAGPTPCRGRIHHGHHEKKHTPVTTGTQCAAALSTSLLHGSLLSEAYLHLNYHLNYDR